MPSGAPCGFAYVTASASGRGFAGESPCNDAGEFAIHGISRFPHTLHAMLEVDGFPLCSATVHGIPGGTRDLVIRLEETPVVSGTVLDANGAPLNGASVTAIVIEPAGERMLATRRTRANGTFRFAVPADATIELRTASDVAMVVAGRAGRQPKLESVRVRSGTRDVVIRLPEAR